jgi:manganese/zinc/iron transport system permease protein
MNDSPIIDFLLLRDLNVRVVVIGSILLGVGSAAIGCFALLRKRALVGDGVAHAVLPGVAIAYMVTGTKNTFALLIGATIAGWISMVVMDFISRRSRIREDAAIGIVLSVFFGLGILLVTHIQATGSSSQSGLDKFLFGQAASLVLNDVVVFGAVSVLLVVAIMLLFKDFKILSFDPEFTQTIGLPARGLSLVMTTLLVLAVVVGIQAVGVVLMAAMLITPAASARYWTDRLGIMLVLASAFGALSGVGGAFVSYVAPRMPTGPWIVMFATFFFVASLLFAPKRGVVARVVRHQLNRRRTLAENILKTMHMLGEDDGDVFAPRGESEIQARRRIPTVRLHLGLRRLQRDGYAVESKERHWRLTQEGARQGARVTRLHRLWEVYLTQYLQIAPDHVHEDAESIEHVLTPELEEELDRLLERPLADPHARAIPRR